MKRIVVALLMSFILIGQPAGVVNASESLTNVRRIAEENSESNDIVVKKTVTWQDKTIEGNLYILEDADITVNGTLTVSGNIYVWGTLTCNGRIKCSGSLNCLYLKYGSMQFSAGGSYSGGKVYLNKGGSIGTMNVTSSWLTTNVPNPCDNGHKWDEGRIVKEATCIITGEKIYTCNICEETKTENIPKINHTVVIDKEVSATCTKSGLTEGKHCSICGEVLKKQEVIKAIGHKSDNGTITVQPTEAKAGVKTYKCTVCGEILKEESIPATGKKDTTTTKPATTESKKPNTKPNPTIKPSIPSLKVGTKVSDSKTKAVYKATGKNTVEYVKTTSKAKSITIPATVTVNGAKCQVTSIAVKAFVNNKKLTKVIIPASIRSIGKQAFSGCKNLKSITIKTPYLTNKFVGAKAFKGIHTKAIIKVPKKQKKAYQKMLKSKGIGKSVKVK